MIAVTGITGQVGRQLADELLANGCRVKAVVRDAAKGQALRLRGCEVAIASMDDEAALTAAFAGASAVFVLLPPVFDPSPGFAETRLNVQAVAGALRAVRPAHVVALSTVGAQAEQPSLLTQLHMLEVALQDLHMQVSVLRAAWFIENVAWDVSTARETGMLPSHLQPCDRTIPMVATTDVAHAAATLLRDEPPHGMRVVELQGPARVSPAMLAAELARALGRDVTAMPVPRADWEREFRTQGMSNPQPRMRMLDGFNEGWIDFERGDLEQWRGSVSLATVISRLVTHSAS